MKRVKLLTTVLSIVLAMGLSVNVYATESVDTRLNSAPADYTPSENGTNTVASEEDIFSVNVNGTQHDIRLNSAPEGYVAPSTRSSNTEQAASDFTDNLDSGILIRANLMPTGGGEYVYNPTYWNDPKIVYRANCYGYVLSLIATDTSDEYAGYLFQPGYKAGKTFTEFTKSNIIKAVEADMGVFGRSIRSSTYSEKPGKDEYKIALVLASNDYHWYRQNADGYWSHKPGLTSITDKDASGNRITDPQTCDRKYSYANYSTWGGYYIISK